MAGYLMDTSGDKPAGGGSRGGGTYNGTYAEWEKSRQRRTGMKYPEYQRLYARPQGTQNDFVSLEDERRKILGIFQNDQNFYNGPDQQALQSMFMGRSAGKDMPFTPNVMQAMFSQNAQGANGAFGAERDMIRQGMTNAGLGGSGAEMSQMLRARTRAQQQVAAGRRDITSRATLENFNARERAQTQAQSFFAQRAAHQQQGAFAEAGFRSQATQQDERPGDAGAASSPQFQTSGAVYDQGKWDRQISDLLKRMTDMQQNSISGASSGEVQAAPVAAPAPASNVGSGGYYPGGFSYGGASTYMAGQGTSVPSYSSTPVPNSPSTGSFPSVGGWAYNPTGGTNYVNRSY